MQQTNAMFKHQLLSRPTNMTQLRLNLNKNSNRSIPDVERADYIHIRCQVVFVSPALKNRFQQFSLLSIPYASNLITVAFIVLIIYSSCHKMEFTLERI